MSTKDLFQKQSNLTDPKLLKRSFIIYIFKFFPIVLGTHYDPQHQVLDSLFHIPPLC